MNNGKKYIPNNVNEFFHDNSFDDYQPKNKFQLYLDSEIEEHNQYRFNASDVRSAIEDLTRSIDREILNAITSLAYERR